MRLALLGVAASWTALGPGAQDAPSIRVQGASSEGLFAIESMQPAEGILVELFAAEPLLANPVCLEVAPTGEVYVGETHRHHAGVTDIREHMDWMEEDLATRTVDERRALLARRLGDEYESFDDQEERIRLIRDTDGDGVADQANVFAGGFSDHTAGIGAGLLLHGGDLYYTCIPDLWRLRDEDGDGRADSRTVLSTGYGVNVSMLGHDLHGLRIGPDYRLYFSCGDRGFTVETENGTIEHPHAGAVLRCELDGSGLEVFHTGLRNPQELAFDNLGNLFTGDNNSDGGDLARWVHVVEGGDSGWRYGYQWIEDPGPRGPWNDEELWKPHFPGRAAYALPPIANVGSGPAGLTHYPGVGLPDAYGDAFFLCDFVGDPAHSGIRVLKNVPSGASFELAGDERFLWNALPTDVEFGADGALYFTDWVFGWEKTGKGRVVRLMAEDPAARAQTEETRETLARGVRTRSRDELARLLGHADQRIRLNAQWELARRREEGRPNLVAAALSGGELLTRLHGIWGVGILARERPTALDEITSLADDPEPEVRAQFWRVAGDAGLSPAGLLEALTDEHPRVRYFAALAAGRSAPPSETVVAELVRGLEIGDTDPTLRHALVMALARSATPDFVASLADDTSVDVRLGAVLVLRRLEHASLARFLDDADDSVAIEAARAVHDLPVLEALPALARALERRELDSSAWVRRAINANVRVGTTECAARVARHANDADTAAPERREALLALSRWGDPPDRDRVLGEWNPIEPRDDSFVPEALALIVPDLLPDDESLAAWVDLQAQYGNEDCTRYLEALLDGSDRSAARVAALRALETLAAGSLEDRTVAALSDADGLLRAQALEILARLRPDGLLAHLSRVLETGELPERRAAYRILADIEGEDAAALLAGDVARLATDLIPAEVALDLIEAAERSGTSRLLGLLEQHGATRAADPELGRYLDGLFGGSEPLGQRIYWERVDLACVRCHSIDGRVSDRVGPDLKGVGSRLTRLQLLESIATPNRRTAPGFTATVLFLDDDTRVVGRIVEETEERIRVQDPDGAVTDVDPGTVISRRPDLSAMPEGLAKMLTRRELRDLIEFLAQL